jgi:hypothetical protein
MAALNISSNVEMVDNAMSGKRMNETENIANDR